MTFLFPFLFALISPISEAITATTISTSQGVTLSGTEAVSTWTGNMTTKEMISQCNDYSVGTKIYGPFTSQSIEKISRTFRCIDNSNPNHVYVDFTLGFTYCNADKFISEAPNYNNFFRFFVNGKRYYLTNSTAYLCDISTVSTCGDPNFSSFYLNDYHIYIGKFRSSETFITEFAMQAHNIGQELAVMFIKIECIPMTFSNRPTSRPSEAPSEFPSYFPSKIPSQIPSINTYLPKNTNSFPSKMPATFLGL